MVPDNHLSHWLFHHLFNLAHKHIILVMALIQHGLDQEIRAWRSIRGPYYTYHCFPAGMAPDGGSAGLEIEYQTYFGDGPAVRLWDMNGRLIDLAAVSGRSFIQVPRGDFYREGLASGWGLQSASSAHWCRGKREARASQFVRLQYGFAHWWIWRGSPTLIASTVEFVLQCPHQESQGQIEAGASIQMLLQRQICLALADVPSPLALGCAHSLEPRSCSPLAGDDMFAGSYLLKKINLSLRISML
jgi:hypothetical protein